MLPEDLKIRRAKKVVDSGGSKENAIPLAVLSEAIITNDKLDALLSKGSIEIPPFPEIPEFPAEFSVSNLPEVQKVEVLNFPAFPTFPEQKAPIVNYSPQEVNVEMNNDAVVSELQNIAEILSKEEVETVEKTEIVDDKGETVNFKKLFETLSERIANIRISGTGGWGGGLSTTDSTALQNLGGKFATRVDDVSTAGVTYVGKAAVGALTSSAVWQIQKIDETGSPVSAVITWAGGANFNQIWSDRLSIGYN
jgi:hypothetical protein